MFENGESVFSLKCYELANELAKRFFRDPTKEQVFELADRVRAAVGAIAMLPKREHIASPDCWCRPTQDTKEPSLWIHNYVH